MYKSTRALFFVTICLLCSQSVHAGSAVTIVKVYNSVDDQWELRVTNDSPLFNVYGFAVAENAATSANGVTDTNGWWDAGVMDSGNWDLGVSGLAFFASQYLTLPTFTQAFPGPYNRAVIYWMSSEENPMAPYPIIEVPFIDSLESDNPGSASFIAPGQTAEVFAFTAVTAGSPYAVLLGDGTAIWSAEYGETVGVGDSDSDGVNDNEDNCIDHANSSQTDSDGDGIGNTCDQDIAPQPNDCVVNAQDLGALKVAFFSTPALPNWNADADFSGDDAVNAIDLGILKADFFGQPGPSGISNDCD